MMTADGAMIFPREDVVAKWKILWRREDSWGQRRKPGPDLPASGHSKAGGSRRETGSSG